MVSLLLIATSLCASAQIIGGVNDPTLPPELLYGDVPDSVQIEQEDQFSIEGARLDYFLIDNPFLFQEPDRDLEDFHISDLRRTYNLYSIARAGLGNLATASNSLVFGPVGNVGFDLMPYRRGSAWEPYVSSPERIRYFRANKPYTKLGYTLGGGVEQVFNIELGRNISPNLGVGLDYTRYVSEGLGQRQKSGIHDLSTGAWFRSRDRKYALTAGFTLSVVEQEDFGGVTVPADSVFDFTTREAVPVFLDDALIAERGRTLHLYQAYHFGPQDSVKLNDSLLFMRTEPRMRVWHELRWNYGNHDYTDPNPDTSYYHEILLRNDSTIIQWAGQGIRNSIGIGNVTSRELQDSVSTAGWKWYVKGTHRFDRPFGALNDTIGGTHDLVVEGWMGSLVDIADTTRNRPVLELGGAFNVRGELRGLARAGWFISGHDLSVGVQSERYQASRLEERFISNHHIWRNSFKQEFWLSPEFRYRNSRWGTNLTAKYHLVDNYRYFDTLSRPRQSDASLGVVQVLFRQDFQFGRFHIDNHMALQWSNSDLVRLPTWWGRHSIYFEGNLFDDAAFVRIGADIRYNTDYFAQAWNPAASVFHQQNGEELSFYPVVDVFLAARIQTARIFISGYNLSQGLLQPGWFQTPGYPMPDLGIRFGVDWIFWW